MVCYRSKYVEIERQKIVASLKYSIKTYNTYIYELDLKNLDANTVRC